MLTQLRRAPLASSDDPVDSLLACHERIRRFSALGARLADADVAPPDEIREAARGVHRYFSMALPLHAADEDESIRPRLESWAGVTSSVRQALSSMSDQHVTIEALLAQALPEWAALAEEDEGRAAAARAVLDEIGMKLARLFHLHLALEEEVVLPALRQLPAEDKAAIAAEMRARRAIGDAEST